MATETDKTIKPEENAEASEMLGYIKSRLELNGGEWDLTDDTGKPVIFDAEKYVYIPHIMLSKGNTPCAVIPFGYFEDDTIRAIVDTVSR